MEIDEALLSARRASGLNPPDDVGLLFDDLVGDLTPMDVYLAREVEGPLLVDHYAVHKERAFYHGLVSFMTSSPVVVMAVKGNSAITLCRKMMGATFGSSAEAGTIRGDFGVSNSFNLIHGSDGPETAREELARFFGGEGIVDSGRAIDTWVYDLSGDEPV